MTTILIKSFHTLKPEQWLDDEIINGYLTLLSNDKMIQYDAGSIPRPSMHMPTHFYTQLTNNKDANLLQQGYQYGNVLRWGTCLSPLFNVFLMELLFIPLHINDSHWAAITVDNTKHTITYLDSLGGQGEQHMANILHYLQDKHMPMFQSPLPDGPTRWRISPPPHNLPHQMNTYDCGASVCFFANRAFQSSAYYATPRDITRFREHMGVSIIKNSAAMA
jgi:Ulp1 family protease